MVKKFTRTDSTRLSRLGKRRKKLQVWRKPKGRHNKMREKRFSYPRRPNVGYKKSESLRGTIAGKTVVMVYNLKDLEKVDNSSVVIIGKIGAKKRMEVMKIALERKMKIVNMKSEEKK